MHPLELDAYRAAVRLDEPFAPSAPAAALGELGTLTRSAIIALAGEHSATVPGTDAARTAAMDDKVASDILRAMLNRRPAGRLDESTGVILDALLGGHSKAAPTTRAVDLNTTWPDTPLALWRGDLTLLSADAIVNAANSGLLGCFQPLHTCIDNAIHSAAGPRLREDCATIMDIQGNAEPSGTAKITRGYHLPARYVLHTVGPVVRGSLTIEHQQALASAYTSCLDLAAKVDLVRTVGFCAISTGVFGYPKPAAARIAIRTILDWVDRHPGRFDRIVLSAFMDADLATYESIIARGRP